MLCSGKCLLGSRKCPLGLNLYTSLAQKNATFVERELEGLLKAIDGMEGCRNSEGVAEHQPEGVTDFAEPPQLSLRSRLEAVLAKEDTSADLPPVAYAAQLASNLTKLCSSSGNERVAWNRLCRRAALADRLASDALRLRHVASLRWPAPARLSMRWPTRRSQDGLVRG